MLFKETINSITLNLDTINQVTNRRKNVWLLHAGQHHGLHGKFLNDRTRRDAKTAFRYSFNSTNYVY